MLWVPPASITSASPRRIISVASPTAWLLAAQAVRAIHVRALGVEHRRQMSRWHIGFLLEFLRRDQAVLDPLAAMNFDASNSPSAIALAIILAERSRKILVAFAAAQVDAKSNRIGDRVDAHRCRLIAWLEQRRSANLVCRPRRLRRWRSADSSVSVMSQFLTSALILVGNPLASNSVV